VKLPQPETRIWLPRVKQSSKESIRKRRDRRLEIFMSRPSRTLQGQVKGIHQAMRICWTTGKPAILTNYEDSVNKLEEKYFDYNGVSLDRSDNPEKNISTTSSSRSSIAACHARGLAVAHSRKLSATLGGSTSTRPGVRKIISRPAISSTSATR
jgi:hypothetical protein